MLNAATVTGASIIQKRNFIHLYLDTFWWGILAGSVISFLGIYLARLGASNFQQSVLTAGPAVLNLLISMPAGMWLESRSLIRATFLTSLYHRVGYIVILLGMFLVAEHMQISMVLWITVLMSIPGTVLMIAFNAMFAETVPPDMRARLVGRRNALLAISMTSTSLISGQLLDVLNFPLNYQIVFGIGILGAALSSYHLGQIRSTPALQPVPRQVKPIQDRAHPGRISLPFSNHHSPGMRFLTRGVEILRPDLIQGPNGAYLGVMFCFYFVQSLIAPLLPTYQVKDMALSDAFIGWGTALFYLVVFFASMGLGAISGRVGNHRLMSYSCIAWSGFPFFIGIFPSELGYLLGVTSGGIGWGFLGGAVGNRLMERVPEDDRPAHMAMFNITLNLGVLVGSLLGPVFGDIVGMQATMLIAASLRIILAWLLWLWG